MELRKTNTDLLRKIRNHVLKGAYVVAKHAITRQEERCITLPDVLRVLEHGRREQDKDVFDVKWQTWKYAIRGKTINGFNLRVVVSFREEMVIITVIRVN